MSNIFVNLETVNNSDSPALVKVNEKRYPYVLTNPHKYLITIDRFSLRKAWLPVFEDTNTLQVRVVRLSDSLTSTETLDFSAYTDVNNMIYDTNSFFTVLNYHLQQACSGAGLASNYPFLTNNETDGSATLDYSATNNFATLYKIEFNEPLYCIFNSFNYTDVVFDQNFFRVTLPDVAPYTKTTADAIDLSPVDKIYIKTNSVPIIAEYTPSNNSTQKSEAILTDFEFGGANRFPLTHINYTSTTGHSMNEANNFETVDLQFYYKTFANNEFPMYMLPSGSVNVKLFFRPIRSEHTY